MPSSATFDLAITELVIYIILFFPIVYIIIRHGRKGWDGWGFLVIFCILRIVSSGMQVSNGDSTSISTAIVNSIGVSGLLLGTSGVVIEAHRCDPGHDPKIVHIVSLILHAGIVAGIVLAAIGASNLATALAKGQSAPASAHSEQIAGYAILFVAVILITLYNLFVLRNLRASRARQDGGNKAVLGTRLLYFVLCALPFIIVRVVYALVYAATQSSALSPFTGSFAIKFALVFLMQLIAILFLIAGGLSSIGIGHMGGQQKATSGSDVSPYHEAAMGLVDHVAQKRQRKQEKRVGKMDRRAARRQGRY